MAINQDRIFQGTRAEWDKLSDEEKVKYALVYLKEHGPKHKQPVVITNPKTVRILLEGYVNKKQEYFGAIALDAGHRVISKTVLFVGTEHYCMVAPRIILSYALRKRATEVVVWHNHPSGNAEPSSEDNSLTARINDACNIVGLRLLDHVIVTRYGYYSYMADGKIKDCDSTAVMARR